MKIISQRELRDGSAAIINAQRRRLTTEDLITTQRRLPRVDAAEMRSDIDEFFGDDRLSDDDNPWERPRG